MNISKKQGFFENFPLGKLNNKAEKNNFGGTSKMKCQKSSIFEHVRKKQGFFQTKVLARIKNILEVLRNCFAISGTSQKLKFLEEDVK